MKLTARFSIPVAAATIALTGFVGVPHAAAAPTYCTYKVVNAPNGLFIRSAPAPTAHTLDKVPNGTTGIGSQAITNGFRTFHGGWASATYLSKINAQCFE